jgi:hypothetical protein
MEAKGPFHAPIATTAPSYHYTIDLGLQDTSPIRALADLAGIPRRVFVAYLQTLPKG